MKSAVDLKRERTAAWKALAAMVRDMEAGFVCHPGETKKWALRVAMRSLLKEPAAPPDEDTEK